MTDKLSLADKMSKWDGNYNYLRFINVHGENYLIYSFRFVVFK
jgi:hypothetical protein